MFMMDAVPGVTVGIVAAWLAATGFTLTTLLSTRLAGVKLVTEHAGSFVPPIWERPRHLCPPRRAELGRGSHHGVCGPPGARQTGESMLGLVKRC
jgi:hypothetical protein